MADDLEQQQTPVRRWEWVALWGLLLLAAAFHAVTINRQSLFVDEANEVVHAGQPWREIAAIPDSMPPLYSYLLKAWTSVFGGEAARWFSAIVGMMVIPAAWRVARGLVGPVVAIVAASLLTISPMLLYYSQLIRAYGLFTLMAVLAIGTFARAVRRNSRVDWILLAVVSTVGMFTHYYFAFVMVSLVIVALAIDAAKFWKPLLAAGVLAALLSSPILYSLKSDFAFQHDLRDPRPLSLPALVYTYVSFFSGYTLGPSKVDLQTMSTAVAAKVIAPWALVIAGCSGVLGLFGFVRLARYRLAWATLLLIFAPVAMAGLLGAATGITYNVRFVAWCVVPLALWMAAGIVQGWPTWIGKLATCGLIGISLVAVYNRTMVPRYQNEDLRSAAVYIRDSDAADDTVFVVSDYLARALKLYTQDDAMVVELPVAGESNHAVLSASDAEEAAAAVEQHATSGAGGYWLVYSRAFHGDPKGELLRRLQETNALQLRAEFAGVKLYHGQVAQDD